MKITPLPDDQNYVNAFDGAIKDVESPMQKSMDNYWNKVTQSTPQQQAPQVIYMQSQGMGGIQKFFIFFAAIGTGYLIYKQFRR